MTEEILEGFECNFAELCSPEDLLGIEQFMLLYKINSTNSNKRGLKYEPMPTLRRAHKLKDNQVFD